jgi:prepilin-type N-terminal cleavage/methylation domain-containing protein
MSRVGTTVSHLIGRRRGGVTLLELLVVFVILAVLVGIAMPRVGLGTGVSVQRDSTERLIRTARREAVRTRQSVTITVKLRDTARMVTAWPDGTVAADSQMRISPFDGRLGEKR